MARSVQRAELRRRLAHFYAERDPAKLADLDVLVETFDGKLGKLAALLREKYGEDVTLPKPSDIRRDKKAAVRAGSGAMAAAKGAVAAACRCATTASDFAAAAATLDAPPPVAAAATATAAPPVAATPAALGAATVASATPAKQHASVSLLAAATSRLGMLLETEAARDMVTLFDNEDEACGEWAERAPTTRAASADPAHCYGMNLRLRSLGSLVGFPDAGAPPLARFERARRHRNATAATRDGGGGGGDSARGPGSSSRAAARRGATEEGFRAELEAIFTAHEPERLHDAGRLAAAYAGRERQHKLIAILAKKYDFDAAALRGGGAARSHNARVPSSAPWECVALHASVNRIGSIEECLLTGVLQHLRVLDLSANRLDDRSFGFNGGAMPHLRIVNLANNALRSVSCLGGLLHGATQLRALDLSLNGIERLVALKPSSGDAQTSTGGITATKPPLLLLPMLERLDLHGNKLRELSALSSFKIGAALLELDLHSNALSDHLGAADPDGAAVGGAGTLSGAAGSGSSRRYAADGDDPSHWTSLYPIAELTGLSSLRLDGCRLSDVSATGSVLHTLSSLNVLTACRNQWRVRTSDDEAEDVHPKQEPESESEPRAQLDSRGSSGDASMVRNGSGSVSAGRAASASGVEGEWKEAPLVAYRRELLRIGALRMLDGVEVDDAMRQQIAALAKHERLMAIMGETSDKFVLETTRKERKKEGVVARLRRDIAAAEDSFADDRKRAELELSRCIGYLEGLAIVPADAQLASNPGLLPTAENVFPEELKQIIPDVVQAPKPKPAVKQATLVAAHAEGQGQGQGRPGESRPETARSATSDGGKSAGSTAVVSEEEEEEEEDGGTTDVDTFEGRLRKNGLTHMWLILVDVEMTSKDDATLLDDEDLLDLGLTADEISKFHASIHEYE